MSGGLPPSRSTRVVIAEADVAGWAGGFRRDEADR